MNKTILYVILLIVIVLLIAWALGIIEIPSISMMGSDPLQSPPSIAPPCPGGY